MRAVELMAPCQILPATVRSASCQLVTLFLQLLAVIRNSPGSLYEDGRAVIWRHLKLHCILSVWLHRKRKIWWRMQMACATCAWLLICTSAEIQHALVTTFATRSCSSSSSQLTWAGFSDCLHHSSLTSSALMCASDCLFVSTINLAEKTEAAALSTAYTRYAPAMPSDRSMKGKLRPTCTVTETEIGSANTRASRTIMSKNHGGGEAPCCIIRLPCHALHRRTTLLQSAPACWPAS